MSVIVGRIGFLIHYDVALGGAAPVQSEIRFHSSSANAFVWCPNAFESFTCAQELRQHHCVPKLLTTQFPFRTRADDKANRLASPTAVFGMSHIVHPSTCDVLNARRPKTKQQKAGDRMPYWDTVDVCWNSPLWPGRPSPRPCCTTFGCCWTTVGCRTRTVPRSRCARSFAEGSRRIPPTPSLENDAVKSLRVEGQLKHKHCLGMDHADVGVLEGSRVHDVEVMLYRCAFWRKV